MVRSHFFASPRAATAISTSCRTQPLGEAERYSFAANQSSVDGCWVENEAGGYTRCLKYERRYPKSGERVVRGANDKTVRLIDREDAERFIEEVRGDEPELAKPLMHRGTRAGGERGAELELALGP